MTHECGGGDLANEKQALPGVRFLKPQPSAVPQPTVGLWRMLASQAALLPGIS